MLFIGEGDMGDAACGAACGVSQLQPDMELHFEMEGLRIGRESGSMIERGAVGDPIASGSYSAETGWRVRKA